MKEEEAKIKKEEMDLKLAEAAFDSFLQENDRLSMESQQRWINKPAAINIKSDRHFFQGRGRVKKNKRKRCRN